MLVCEVMFGNECPNKLIKKAKRDICKDCKYKEDIYWNFVICKYVLNYEEISNK